MNYHGELYLFSRLCRILLSYRFSGGLVNKRKRPRRNKVHYIVLYILQ